MPSRPTLALALALLAACGVSDDDPEGGSADSVWVSAALPNRAENDGVRIPWSQHGEHCVGFLHDAFDPHAVTPEVIAGGAVALDRSTGLEWMATARPDSVLALARFADVAENRVIHIAEVVRADAPRVALLSLGSDDGVTVWLNGDSLHTRHVGRVLQPHDDLVEVPLRRGSNVILYKVDQGDGGWALFRRVLHDSERGPLLDRLASRLWADPLDASIIADTAAAVSLRPDARRALAAGHRVVARWSLADGSATSAGEWTGDRTPRRITAPPAYPAVLDLAVMRPDGTALYRECLPVYSEGAATTEARAVRRPPETPAGVARRNAVRDLFGPAPSPPTSTRIRATALWDLVDPDHPGPSVWGYRSPNGDVETVRLFRPAGLQGACLAPGPHPLLVVSYGVMEPGSFWANKEGASHALASARAALATDAQVLIAQVHGRGAGAYRADLRAVPEALAREGLALAAPTVLAFSRGADDLVRALADAAQADEPLGYATVALVSPIVTDGPEADEILDVIARATPDLRWVVRHGMDDADVPVHATRTWVQRLRQAGFAVDYAEMPFASHWTWPSNPIRQIAMDARVAD